MSAPIVLSTRVNAPPEAVFRCFEEERLMREWIEGLEAFQYLDEGPSQLGRRFRQTNRMGGRTVYYDGVVTAWEKPVRFAAKVQSPSYTYDMSFELREEGLGTTMCTKVS